MTHAHTPGPWRYVRANPSPTTGEHMIAGSKPGYLAEIRDCGSGDVVANARLIAAAPALHAALIKIVANAAESPEWIRMIAAPALAAAASCASHTGHDAPQEAA